MRDLIELQKLVLVLASQLRADNIKMRTLELAGRISGFQASKHVVDQSGVTSVILITK